jgi:hypothetical protein
VPHPLHTSLHNVSAQYSTPLSLQAQHNTPELLTNKHFEAGCNAGPLHHIEKYTLTHTLPTKTTHKTRTAAQEMAHSNTVDQSTNRVNFYTHRHMQLKPTHTRTHTPRTRTPTPPHTFFSGMAFVMHKLQIVGMGITNHCCTSQS